MEQAQQESSPVAAGIKSALESATFGLSETAANEINAGLEAVSTAIGEGLNPLSSEFKDRVIQIRSETLPKLEAAREAEKQAFPGATLAGEIGGLVSPVGPAAAVTRAGGRIAASALPKIAGGSKIVSGAARGAGEAAAFEGASQVLDPESQTDISGAAGLGAGIGVAPGAIGAIGKRIKEGCKSRISKHVWCDRRCN